MNKKTVRHQMPKPLMEVSEIRCVGFRDAVRELGLHLVCGHMVPFSVQHVRHCLESCKPMNEELLERIAVRKPEMFGLRYVCREVEEWARKKGVDVDAMRQKVRQLRYATEPEPVAATGTED